jgi:hypothetical protein
MHAPTTQDPMPPYIEKKLTRNRVQDLHAETRLLGGVGSGEFSPGKRGWDDGCSGIRERFLSPL